MHADDMIDAMYAFAGSDATNYPRAWCLARLNDAYQQFLSGAFVDDDGRTRQHTWSFLQPTASLSITAADVSEDMPAGFGGLLTNFVHRNNVYGYPAMKERTAETVRSLYRDNGSTITGSPEFYAIIAKDNVTTDASHAYTMIFFPKADQDYVLDFRYRVVPAALTDAATAWPVGNAEFHHAVFLLGMAQVEQWRGSGAGQYTALAAMEIRKLVALDAAVYDRDGAAVERLSDADDGMF